MICGSAQCRTDLSNARIYNNGLAVTWKGDRPGRCITDLKRQAKTKRHFKVKRTRLQSASIAAWASRRSKFMLFITITFPLDVTEIQASKVWDLFLNSLRNTYKIKHYVWVKELQSSGRLHYHVIIDSNWINIKALQGSFENAVHNVCGVYHDTHNSVRLGKDPIVRSVVAVGKYLSKYCSKGEELFTRRAYGHSELTLYRDMTTEELLSLLVKHSLYAKTLTSQDSYSLYFLPLYIENYEKISSS